MHIGIGYADSQVLDVDHNDMRVGGADIVLDDQPSHGPRGGCGQAWMVELQLGGAIKASHEGGNQWPVGLLQAISGSAVQRLLGHLRLQGIELLVRDP